MKLPNYTPSTAESLTPETTPEAAARTSANPFKTIHAGLEQSSEVYKATTAASFTRAATTFIAGYTEGMAEFERSPNVKVQELEAMGLDIPVDFVEEVLTEDGNYQQYVPNWAVSEQFHKKLVNNLLDEGAAQTKTMGARSRFTEEFTQRFGNEQLLKVQRTAFKQMQLYHQQQLFNDVKDLISHGYYDEASQALMRGVAADTISQPQMHEAISEMNRAREHAGYVEIVETGSIAEQRSALYDLLQSLEDDGKYGGVLTPGERQRYINQLQRNLAAVDNNTEGAGSVPAELTLVEKALERGDSYPPEYLTQLQAKAAATGKQQYVWKADALVKSAEAQQMYRYLPQAELNVIEDKLRKQKVKNPTDSFQRGMMLEFSKLRRRETRTDGTGYFIKYGPDNMGDPELNAKLADAKQDAFANPNGFDATIEARSDLAGVMAYFLGREPTLLSKAETLTFNTVFNSGDMASRRQALATIGALSPEQADAVYSELTAVAQADSALFISAGQHYQDEDPVTGDLLIQAYANKSDPNVQKYTSSAGLQQEVAGQLSNFSVIHGSKAGESMRQAVVTTYAYFAAMQGVDHKKVDSGLLKKSTEIALGSGLTDVGRTRLIKISLQSTTQTNNILLHTDAAGWKRAFMDVTFSDDTPIDFNEMPSSLRSGETFFINVPGSTRNVFMLRNDRRGVPTLIFDADGDPVMLDFRLIPPIKRTPGEKFIDGMWE